MVLSIVVFDLCAVVVCCVCGCVFAVMCVCGCVLWLRSGREHCAWMVVVEVRRGTLGVDGRG